jgi:hypothetical protein
MVSRDAPLAEVLPHRPLHVVVHEREKGQTMEATVLTIFVAILYSIVGLAFIVLPLCFTDSPGQVQALDDVRATSLSQRPADAPAH